MQEKLDKGLFFGLIGNVLFVAFGVICYIFYLTYKDNSFFSRALEAIAYCTEFLGFGLLIYADYLLAASLRLRNLLKISFTAYIVLEAVILALELNSYRIEFYKPYSMAIAIVHAVISGAACLAFLQLDPDNPKFELTIVISIAMVFCGMLGVVLGIRAYFGVLINALSFAVLFALIRFLRSREEIEIDCNGDQARVAEYTSSMFADDDSDIREDK